MDCKEFNSNLPDMFDLQPCQLRDNMLKHMETCVQCAQVYQGWRDTVTLLTPSARITAPDNFKQRIMQHSNGQNKYSGIKYTNAGINLKRWRKVLFAAAAVLLAGFSFSLFYPGALFKSKKTTDDPQQFLSLVTQAMAAQQELIYSEGVTYLAVKHVLPAVSNPSVAGSRWFSMSSLRPDGSVQSNRVMTRARPNQPYEVTEELWIDYDSGRFAHVVSFQDEILFANAFDGTNINTLSIENESSVISTPVTPEFSLPEKMPQRFGMLADWDSLLMKKYLEENLRMSLTGEQTLESGETVRVIQIKGLPDHTGVVRSLHLRKIRTSDNTLAETESIVNGETSILTRYLPPEKIYRQANPWFLDGLLTVPKPVCELYGLSLEMDVIRWDITRGELLELCEIPICDFDSRPAWTDSTLISFSRMFRTLEDLVTIIYKAAPGGKHVVLDLSSRWSQMTKHLKIAGPLYVSPSGFKIYPMGDRAKWFANITITASSGYHRDQPSINRVAYFIETPADTWCQLAINGTLSDSELHALVDKLVMLPRLDTTLF